MSIITDRRNTNIIAINKLNFIYSLQIRTALSQQWITKLQIFFLFQQCWLTANGSLTVQFLFVSFKSKDFKKILLLIS